MTLSITKNGLCLQKHILNQDRRYFHQMTIKKIGDIQKLSEDIKTEIRRFVVGYEDISNDLIITLLCGGHVLLEGIPGIAKTYLAKAFSGSLNLSMRRIQATPDLMPADIVGTRIYNPKTLEFEFRHGPIFSNLAVVDEISRAPPKTQSALLEAMQERQVTVDGFTLELKEPFMVIATKNPIEFEGTFPLPEAQLDRFLMRPLMTYPGKKEEVEILSRKNIEGDVMDVKPVAESSAILSAQKLMHDDVQVSDGILEYIAEIVRNTREHTKVMLGGSPRGSVALLYAAKGYAIITEGRSFVVPDDVKAVAFNVLNHRLIVRPDILIESPEVNEGWSYKILQEIIHEAIDQAVVPV